MDGDGRRGVGGWVVVAVIAGVALLGGAVVAAVLFLRVSGTAVEAIPVHVGRVDASSVEASSVELDWETYAGTLGPNTRMFESRGVFYALSTAPGELDPGAFLPGYDTLYLSETGESWTSVPLGGVLEDRGRVWDLASAGGTLYMVGTAPSAVADADLMVVSTGDAGETFQTVSFPLLAPPPAGVDTFGSSVWPLVAAGDSTVVAMASVSYWVDWQPLVPPALMMGEVGVEQTADGLRVVSWGSGVEESECTVFDRVLGRCGTGGDASEVWRATWEELGVDRPPFQTFVFVSDAGGPFRAASEPPEGNIRLLRGGSGGFVAITGDGDVGRGVWTSVDGDRWVETDPIDRMGWIIDAGVVHGALVVVGHSPEGSAMIASSDDGGDSWSVTELGPSPEPGRGEEAFVEQAGVGPAGVAVAVSTVNAVGAVRHDLYVTTDLENWEVQAFSSNTWLSQIVVGDGRVFANLVDFRRLGPGSSMHQVAWLSP